jgi:hypothetical protein
LDEHLDRYDNKDYDNEDNNIHIEALNNFQSEKREETS